MKKFLIILLVFPLFAKATNYYFSSSTGSDGGTGTIGSPWATITKFNTLTPVLGDSVLFKAGDNFPVAIAGFRPHGANYYIGSYGVGVFPFFDASITLSSWTNLGGGVYSASCAGCSPSLNLLVVDGIPQTMARLPNSGFSTFSANSGTTQITTGLANGLYIGDKIVIRDQAYIYDRAVLSGNSSGVLTFAPGMSYSTGLNGNGFFLQNDDAFLDTLYEWTWNSPTVKVFFGSDAPSSHVIKVSGCDSLLYYTGAGLTVEHINFGYANKFAANFNFSSTGSNTFRNNSVIFSGGVGLWVNNNHYFTATGNVFYWTLDNAIWGVGGSSSSLVQNNIINYTGQIPGMGGTGAGGTYEAINFAVDGIQVLDNTINWTGYIPIYVSKDSANVRRNHIDYFCNVKHDGGAVYIWDATETVYANRRHVVGNVINHGMSNYAGLIATGDSSASSSGVYLDAKASHVSVDSNIITNCESNGILNHGDSNSFSHNQISGNKYAQVQFAEIAGLSITGTSFTNNHVQSKILGQKQMMFSSTVNSTVNFCSLDSNFYRTVKFDNTPFYTKPTGGGVFRSLSSWKSYLSQDAASVISDPTYIALMGSKPIFR